MDRRQFLRATSTIVTAAGTASPFVAPALAATERHPIGAPIVRRFDDERWVLDNIIQANGVDWDQPHTIILLRACGLDIAGDMNALRQRVKKYADIAPAFEALAQRREKLAKAAEAAREKIPARDNYFFATQFWATAMWPIDEVDDTLKMYNTKKREMFTKYIQYADHHVEWAEIPYRGKTLPAVFHLPPGYRTGTKVPVVVIVPGMDGYKEKYVSLYADDWMQRGVAALSVEGPGYWEAPLRGIYVDVPGWAETGKEVVRWLMARPEIDPERIAITGSSFGSFFSAVMMSDEPRYKAGAITGTCYEPGCHALFDTASPTFKRRFMFMSGITDEGEFEQFRKTLDWHGYAEKVKAPYLVMAGGSDELCPIEYTEQFVKALGGPKQLMIYQDSRHGVGGVPSTYNGPDPRTFQAEWIMARLAGKPFDSERWFIEASGKVDKSALQLASSSVPG